MLGFKCVTDLYKVLIHYIGYKNNLTYEDKEIIVNSFPEPEDDFERAYYQYLCKMKTMKMPLRMGLKIAGFFSYKIAHLLISVKAKKEVTQVITDVICVSEVHENGETIPPSINSQYCIRDIHLEKGYAMDLTVKEILKEVERRYRKDFYFRLICLIFLSQYAYAIKKFHPKIILSQSETSPSFSLLTYYCEKQEIEHIMIMHGERYFTLRNSFFRCHKGFVWDEYYVALLKKSRASTENIKIEIPNALIIKKQNNQDKRYFLTFYLGGQDEKTLYRIKNIIQTVQDLDYKCCVRPHPRAYASKFVKSIFDNCDIQNPVEVSLMESLNLTENAVSTFSTILFKAYLNGFSVVLDDVSEMDYLRKAKAYDYILLEKNCKMLSSVLLQLKQRI